MVSRAHGQKTILIDFPIDSYFGAIGQTSDVDGDGTPDTIITHDEALEMLITDDGTLHVWAGNYWLYDDAPDVEGWTYFPLSAGIWYWNSLTEETKLINGLLSMCPAHHLKVNAEVTGQLQKAQTEYKHLIRALQTW